ncbi:MAG: amino acid adenylation domain-containing protein [Mycobacterium sp.]
MSAPAVSAQAIRAEVAELLGVAPESVAPDDDLIGQGLDSIRMMTLSGRWRRQGLLIDFQRLAAEPTVSAWAALLGSTEPVDPGTPAAHVDADTDPGAPFALAPMQHAMWVGRNDNQQLGGVAGHLYVEFDGIGVDPQRLRTAAAALARRHPMLRVEFLPDGTQRIGQRGLPVTVGDLRELDAAGADERLRQLRETKSHQRLDGEVLQLTLTQLPGDRTRLHVDLDMQAADAVSYRTLMSDLAGLYRGAHLDDLGYTYREYRTAMTGRSGPQPSEADRQWWADRLAELPGAPALPQVPEPEQADPQRTTRRWHLLDRDTRDSLYDNARRRRITPAMAVAASFAGTLRRWADTPRFLLNVPLFGREPWHADVDKLVGDFTSSLLLDVDLTDTRTAADRAVAVQDSMRRAAGHAGYPGLSVLRDLGRARGHQVLAPVVFTSALGLGELFGAEVTDTFGTPVWIISQGPQVLLDAQVTEFDGGVLVNWDVREDAFRPGVIDAMFAHHVAELNRLAAGAAAWDADDPPAVTDVQRARRDALNSVTTPPCPDALHDGFFATAARTPDATAVLSSFGSWTYRELRDQVLAVAAALRRSGVRPGDVVAVMGPKTAEQIPALLGIHSAGAVYLPIGPDQPAERAERILVTAGVRCGLVCGPQNLALPVPSSTVAETLRDGAPRVGETTPAAIDPAQVAYILSTSGSTGEPKAVEVTHAAAMNTVEFINSHFGLGPAARCLALSTLECDLSVLDIFGTLRAGGSIVVVDEEHRRNPDSWAELIRRHGVSVLHFMPGWLEMLAEVAAGQLDSVRVIPTGGDWVRPELVRAWRALAPSVRFAGLGGATETATHNTICEPGDIPPAWMSVPLGRPLPNNACRVVAGDGTDCPDWVPGEFWVAGRGIARGYRGRPDLTAERFVEHDGRTWYRTGDLVRYLPDGLIEFVGRTDHRVKISGYRVELGDVEKALTRIAGVDGAVAAVLPAAGDRPGASDRLAAVVRLGDPGQTAAGITAQLRKFVPAHMVPGHLVFVEQIPFTVGGKIDRAAVTALLAGSTEPDTAEHRAPDGPVERALADILSTLLGRRDIGADDDFFSLGGDSVLATAAVGQIRQWLHAPAVMVADIFATRTVATLAALLRDHESDPDRLTAVAEVYLEVAEMDGAEVISALGAS